MATLGLGSVGSHAFNQTPTSARSNAATDFEPVAMMPTSRCCLCAGPAGNNLLEFIAYAKANQSKMQHGSAGVGSATHLGCILFNGDRCRHHPHPPTAAAPGHDRSDRRPHDAGVRSAPPRCRRSPAAASRRWRFAAAARGAADLPTAHEQACAIRGLTWNALFAPGRVARDHPQALRRHGAGGVHRQFQPGSANSAYRQPPPIVARRVPRQVRADEIEWAVPIKPSGISVD